MDAIMAALGNLASRAQLGRLGIGRHRVDEALADGRLLRVKPGWVATRDALQPAVIATIHGGRLTGPTALRTLGLWAGDDLRVHVQHSPGTHRAIATAQTPLSAFAPLPRFQPTGLRFHAAAFRMPAPTQPAWRVPLADSLVRFGKYEPAEQVAAALSSAVQTRLMNRAGALTVLGRLPKRLHPLASKLTFLDGSGLETIFRLRIAPLGCHVEQQRQIGIDRVDFVLDGWLVIEVDGDTWHEPKLDRARTNRLIRAGFSVLRFGYDEVMDDWDATMHTIRTTLSGRPWS